MQVKIPWNENFHFDYRFKSVFTERPFGEERVTEIHVALTARLETESEPRIVGKGKFSLMRLEPPIDENNLKEMWNRGETYARICTEIYDVPKQTFSKPILERYSDMILEENLLVLERLEILPDYRGRYFGAVMLKDVIRYFADSFNLVALRAIPLLPLSWRSEEPSDDWRKKLELEKFETNKSLAKR
ncbi:MAG: hypothetical protein AAF570_17620, partial [Bacteroidota bacterium]